MVLLRHKKYAFKCLKVDIFPNSNGITNHLELFECLHCCVNIVGLLIT